MHPSGLRSALAFTFALVLAPSARSAVITVDTLSPRPLLYQCDFRSAVIAANTNMPARGCPAGDPHMPDEIRFHPGLAGSISMAVPVEIAESLVIDGGDADRIVLDTVVVTSLIDEPFELRNIGMNRGLLIGTAGSVLVDGVRFKDISQQMIHASAISVPNTRLQRLEIRDSEFLNNHGGTGAVVLNTLTEIDEVEVVRSRFVNNRAHDVDGAGAIVIASMTRNLVVRDSEFIHNHGHSGAIRLVPRSMQATVEISGNRFLANQSLEEGGSGAIHIEGEAGTVHIRECDFLSNHAINSGRAGAITVSHPAGLVVERSVFDGNRALEAGAIHSWGSGLDIVNSSLTRNLGHLAGALALTGDSRLDLRFTAVVDNEGGPSISLDPAGVESAVFTANLMRSRSAPLCDHGWIPLSQGFNLHSGDLTCGLIAPDDRPITSALSSYPAAPGRPWVPAPGHSSIESEIVPEAVCLDTLGADPVDIRGSTRPWTAGTPMAGGYCDAGPIERGEDDGIGIPWR